MYCKEDRCVYPSPISLISILVNLWLYCFYCIECYIWRGDFGEL